MISIIVPVYNAELYIDRCIQSIIEQTYKDIEIILVDDGSLDKSGEIIKQWSFRDKRIKVIFQENKGVSMARNVGLDLATGEEIIFIDSDDFISKDMCKTLHELLKKYNCDIAIASIKHFFNDEYDFQHSDEIEIFSPKEVIINMWYQKKILPSACATIFKKQIFQNIRFKENIIFEDVQMMPKIFQNATSILYTEDELYGYYHHEGSITTNPFSKKDLLILDICKEHLDNSRNMDEDYFKAAKAYYVVGALRIYLNATKEFQQYIKKSEKIIKTYGKQVLKDKNIRKKLKYSLILFFYARPLLKIIYRRINRWK